MDKKKKKDETTETPDCESLENEAVQEAAAAQENARTCMRMQPPQPFRPCCRFWITWSAQLHSRLRTKLI